MVFSTCQNHDAFPLYRPCSKEKVKGVAPYESQMPFAIDVRKEIETAVKLHHAGDLEGAGRLYRQILRMDPANSDALHLSGVMARQKGDNDEAERLISAAIRVSPHCALYHCSLGDVYLDQKKADAALARYRDALKRDPACAQAYAGMGALFETNGCVDQAIQCYENGLDINPCLVDTYRDLFNILKSQRRFKEAMACLKKGIEQNPGAITLWTDLGNSYREAREWEKAADCYKRTVALAPDCEGPYYNLGNALSDQGRFQEAIASYRTAVGLNPKYPEAYNNMGNAFYAQGAFQEAAGCYEQALKAKYDYPDAWKNLGLCFEKQGLVRHATDCYRLALSLNPSDAGCHSGLLFAMHYDVAVSAADIYSESQNWWRQHGSGRVSSFGPRRDSNPSKRLRVGYVSPDFREHSVSYFLRSLLEGHSQAVETFCYADVKRPDRMTVRLKRRSDHWRCIAGMNNETAARLAAEDRIDILVDLAGHTTHNRLLLFARRAAPVQVTWLGYPNTTGMPVMDYRLTDAVADPEGEADAYHTERLIRLPEGFLCYAPPEEAGEVSGLPALNQDRITFGSFNNLAKVNDKVVAVWCRILNRLTESSLMLKSKSLVDERVRQRYLQLFSRHGISADRIQFVPHLRTIREHLTLYSRVDVGLDPFPYNGTTTTCEALWMGVPVVTLKGHRHSARVGSSILTQIGLEELISSAEDEYVNISVGLAADFNRLATLRMNMRTRMRESPLCRTESFAEKVESAYRMMWQKWCLDADPL